MKDWTTVWVLEQDGTRAAPQCQILSPTWHHEDQIKQATLSKKNKNIKSIRAEAAFPYVQLSVLDVFIRAYLM